MKCASFIAVFLSLATAQSFSALRRLSRPIVDLSVDLQTASLDSLGAERTMDTALAVPRIRSGIVLEHGRIVAEYARDDISTSTTLFQVWSVTKSWTSLLIGIVIDSGLLSLDETLGDVWPDDDDNMWSEVRNATVRMDVTIQSLLTMSSGLIDGYDLDVYEPQAAVDVFVPPRDADIIDGDAGGATLVESLSWPKLGVKGKFTYLSVSNILSYVIKKRTGLSPREYALQTVFPALGIKDSDIEWRRNEDGMEYSYIGLRLTTHQMAKFGQLYLQEGLAGPNKRVVSSEWISQSTSPQVEAVYIIPTPASQLFGHYGYLFWIPNGTWIDDPDSGYFYCAIGIGGQNICVHPELDRVSVQQRDYTEWTDVFAIGLEVAATAFNRSLSFSSDQVGGTSSGTSLGTAAYAIGPLALLVAVAFL